MGSTCQALGSLGGDQLQRSHQAESNTIALTGRWRAATEDSLGREQRGEKEDEASRPPTSPSRRLLPANSWRFVLFAHISMLLSFLEEYETRIIRITSIKSNLLSISPPYFCETCLGIPIKSYILL